MEFQADIRKGDRRLALDRRSGVDTRTPEERLCQGERRVNPDRRLGIDRRMRAKPHRRRFRWPYILLFLSALCWVDLHYFDGEHSERILVRALNDFNAEAAQWVGTAFPR